MLPKPEFFGAKSPHKDTESVELHQPDYMDLCFASSDDPDLAEVFSEDDESSTCTFRDHSELLSDEEEDSGWSSGFSTTIMSTPLGQTICSRVSALMDLSAFNSPGSIHYKPGAFTISDQVHLMTSAACVSQCKDCDGSCQEDSLLPAKALDQLDLNKSVSDESTTEIPVSQNVRLRPI